jgi:hypothetical protein
MRMRLRIPGMPHPGEGAPARAIHRVDKRAALIPGKMNSSQLLAITLDGHLAVGQRKGLDARDRFGRCHEGQGRHLTEGEEEGRRSHISKGIASFTPLGDLPKLVAVTNK